MSFDLEIVKLAGIDDNISSLLKFRANHRPVYIYWESVLFPGTIINETTSYGWETLCLQVLWCDIFNKTDTKNSRKISQLVLVPVFSVPIPDISFPTPYLFCSSWLDVIPIHWMLLVSIQVWSKERFEDTHCCCTWKDPGREREWARVRNQE